jgi:hypothetical protein
VFPATPSDQPRTRMHPPSRGHSDTQDELHVDYNCTTKPAGALQRHYKVGKLQIVVLFRA